MMKPLFMVHPTDENAYTWEDEYYFGDALLVAPLLEENAKSRKLYLPEGEWVGFFSESVYEGGSVLESTKEDYPVFIRRDVGIGIDKES